MKWRSLLGSVRARAATQRSRRFFAFVEHMPRPLALIDLGGSAEMWHRWGVKAAHEIHITLVNNHHIDVTHKDEAIPRDFMDVRVSDVRGLTRDDLAAFDVILSNSMLEHLSARDDQEQLAARIIESGKPYFVQVPNKHCIVDPHFPHPLAPFFAALPRGVQARMLSMHSLGSGSRSPDYAAALQRLRFYTPIARRDLARLFPGATVVTEWTMGLPMSLVATGNDPMAN